MTGNRSKTVRIIEIAESRHDYPRSVDKPELIRTIQEAHQRVAGAIEHVPDERLLEPAMDDWTGKDLLAHMAWWHDHSVRVIEGLRADRQPYDTTDPANSTDALNERTHREHMDDPPELTRRTFNESFSRLLAALEPARMTSYSSTIAGPGWTARHSSRRSCGIPRATTRSIGSSSSRFRAEGPACVRISSSADYGSASTPSAQLHAPSCCTS